MIFTIGKKIKFCAVILILMMFAIMGVFPAGSGEKIPVKPSPIINIPDGEFLRYGNYSGGEKTFDAVYVTVRKTDENGKPMYYIYSTIIPLSSKKKLSEDYTTWPTLYKIDPVLGSVIEAKQLYDLNDEDRDAIAKFGMGDIFYTYYLLHLDKQYVEFITKSTVDKNQNNIKEKRYKVEIKDDFPSWESSISFFFAPRIMDLLSKGIIYSISPQFMKEPMPLSYSMGMKKTLQTAAGTFKVYKLEVTMMDPFLGKLMGGFISGSAQWIEDSDRKLVVKLQRTPTEEAVLEEISSVQVR